MFVAVANGYADGWRERAGGASRGFNAYAFDPQGTLQGEDVNSNTLRTAVNTYVYDGYGDFLGGLHVGTGQTTGYNQDPVQFGGQYGYYTDVSTGEVDLTHRYYDPSTGHFLNRDPIGYNGGQNLYAFCGNNPINRQDPKGTDDDTNGWTYLSGVFDYATPHDYWIAARYNSVTRAVLTLGDLASWIPGPENPAFDAKVALKGGVEAVEGGAKIAGLFRKTANTGAFSDLAVLMSKKSVLKYAKAAGIGLSGVTVRISRDADLVGKGYYGWSDGKMIVLFPEAFRNVEELIKTLAHERMHVYQARTLGLPLDSGTLASYERAAQIAENDAWNYYQKTH